MISPSPGAALNDPATLKVADIQGVILRGYRHHVYIRFLVLRIRAADGAREGARELCRRLTTAGAAEVAITSAQPWSERPPYCLNLGVTASGLKKLVGEENYDAINSVKTSEALFTPFHEGAAARADKVLDNGESAPAKWWRNGNWQLGPEAPPSNDDLDLLVGVYAMNAADRETFAKKFLATIPAAADGAAAIVTTFVQDSDPLPGPDGCPTEKIHFGYVDGLSQPRVKDTPWYKPVDAADQRPPVESWRFVMRPRVPGVYRVHPVLANGCYGAFRLLFQDVAKFEAFIAQTGQPELVAAKMCGRWRDGTPLILSPEKPDPSIQGKALSNFHYTADPEGAVCPFAAHVRRSNPRDDTAVRGNVDDAASHRVMRRARPYGPPFERDPQAQRGLVGLFLGVNLEDQFEFVMQQWVAAPGSRSIDTTSNQSGVDPLFGPMDIEDPKREDFIYREKAADGGKLVERKVTGLSRFVRTDGALYVLIPSLSALKLFAAGQVEEGGKSSATTDKHGRKDGARSEK